MDSDLDKTFVAIGFTRDMLESLLAGERFPIPLNYLGLGDGTLLLVGVTKEDEFVDELVGVGVDRAKGAVQFHEVISHVRDTPTETP